MGKVGLFIICFLSGTACYPAQNERFMLIPFPACIENIVLNL